MTAELTPLRQGDLDFFCGIYAAINAMKVHGAWSHIDQAAWPFRLAIAAIAEKGDLSVTITEGMEEEDFAWLIRKMWYGDLTVEYPIKALGSVASDRIAELLAADEAGPGGAVIVALRGMETSGEFPEGYLEHYTVITSMDDKSVKLMDSSNPAASLVWAGDQVLYEGRLVRISRAYRLSHSPE